MTKDIDARSRISAPVLALGDAAAIVLFVIVGLTNHDEGITLNGIARTALPILGAWILIAPFTKAYTAPGIRTLLLTWVIAVPVGIAIRAILLERAADGSQLAFAIVAMTTTLIFLIAARAAITLAARLVRRPREN